MKPARLCVLGDEQQLRIGFLPTHPIRTLRAPKGVTSIGGANVYAAKFATVSHVRNLGRSIHSVKDNYVLPAPLKYEKFRNQTTENVTARDAQVDIPAHHIGFRR
jgi:hypothetical protein